VIRLELDLTLPADRRLLAATRKVVAVCLGEFGTPREVVDDIILAMDEACSNVLVHAFPGDDIEEFTYRLCADVTPGEIQIEVQDNGIGFDVMAKPKPRGDNAHMATGGRGLEVMRRLMTSVEVESPTATGGTRLRLVRKLPPGVV
jgi:anti-sigma regulatory factor (Ser/Thr protein kinase)